MFASCVFYIYLFWNVISTSLVESKKIQAEYIQSKACFEAAIQSEGKASEGKARPNDSVKSLLRSRDSVGRVSVKQQKDERERREKLNAFSRKPISKRPF